MSDNTKVINPNIRNIAIIAHVDHGKTTLVDHLFRQSGLFRSNQEVAERVMDSMDLERERGITIAAKNCSVKWGDVKINILDTPGHADFGGEVERAMMMVDGCILLVDSSEGPLPQTRFVLRKALEAGISIIVVVNKIDRQDARPQEVLNEVYDLFIDLDATEDQLDFPVLYAIGREGVAMHKIGDDSTTLAPLFDTIVKHIPGPSHNPEQPFQMLVTNLSYSDYLGRLAIGRVFNGTARKNERLARIGEKGTVEPLRVSKLQVYQGISFAEVDQAEPGEIIILSGIEDVSIGDTICTLERPLALPRITVDEPTISMKFMANTSPFSGKEGKLVQPQKIKERLHKEALYNVALKIEESTEDESCIVRGRGEFQMAILIETMRREGFELTVGRPQIIYKETNGEKHEPIEHLIIDCDEAHIGILSETLSIRRGKMVNMVNHGTGRVRLEFEIPSRGLIGYRNQFLTDTRGTGIMNSYLKGYEPYKGDFMSRQLGSLVADRQGEAIPYAIFGLQPRGKMFVQPQDPVYEGMVVGEHNRDNDLNVNICREKKLTNIRAAAKDENVILTPVVPLTLEKAIDFIRDDELVEVTPKSIRIRKTILPANKRS
ncbi:MAG: GTP-binding protein TypA/BipA [Pseudomonadota bacterium]|jgi:GTP-binding protein